LIARILALTLAATFSFSAFAGRPSPTESVQDQTDAKIKELLACDEIEGAQHVILTVVMGLASAFSSSVAQDLEPYEAEMSVAKTCEQYSAAYATIEAVAKKNGIGIDFSTPEGKAYVEEVLKELRKLK